MKQVLPAAALLALFFVACRVERPLDTRKSDNNRSYTVDYLFTHDGCKVYRFMDDGHYVYFTICDGDNASHATNSVMYPLPEEKHHH